MMTVLFLACALSVIMLVWFNSEAVIEYGSLLGLKSILDIEGFKNEKIQLAPTLLTYPMYLKLKHNCFGTRLLGCKLCFSLVFSILIGVAIMSPLIIPEVCVGALLLYGAITKLIDLK